MKNQDRNRADARFNKPNQPRAGKSAQDIAAKAVLDNMARLKALRLAREAAEPPRAPDAIRKRPAKVKKSEEKAPDLSEWLAGQQGGGRRT
jgi:hypothetical protein